MRTIMFSRRAALAIFGLAAGGMMLAGVAVAATAPIANQDGVAIKGFDTVAYWTEGKAVKGNPLFKHSWNGAEWQFASAANRDMFAMAPEKYAPEYGGYCAFGMTLARPVQPDPTQWRIVDGRLFFASGEGALSSWIKDMPAAIAKGMENWPKVKAQ